MVWSDVLVQTRNCEDGGCEDYGWEAYYGGSMYNQRTQLQGGLSIHLESPPKFCPRFIATLPRHKSTTNSSQKIHYAPSFYPLPTYFIHSTHA
jgi:hypothetical protein